MSYFGMFSFKNSLFLFASKLVQFTQISYPIYPRECCSAGRVRFDVNKLFSCPILRDFIVQNCYRKRRLHRVSDDFLAFLAYLFRFKFSGLSLFIFSSLSLSGFML